MVISGRLIVQVGAGGSGGGAAPAAAPVAGGGGHWEREGEQEKVQRLWAVRTSLALGIFYDLFPYNR